MTETSHIFAPNDESGLDKSTMWVSKDKEINEFGKYLLNMCAPFSLIILNGTLGDECGKFTYISTSGCSVIDYFIVARQLLHMRFHCMLLKRLNRSICRLNFLLELKTKDRSNQKTHLKHIKLKNTFGVTIKVMTSQHA